ncbi:MAG: UDP-N-acetylenolpyruvoylglucosamine reductase [Candidatus Taylorbacteria bacterium RIFCSPHIGHO2_02_FULL_46_13]|uniref:UDP-N-acetylenolpyruvoylglucosamine reductase n=1 Tax=Candidatus Taylorbacteria bacterium RIFCSPHIGHO2_02_FULL_46_13 TaxID=1802312 RepID=A0A1G2MRJ3_9BACT|nr:MAG: UDP-N-acetylenolpyruvoylglucosamine reductase [Candidatus Taylorbacteria bacterium RIFCSPHIGHO2_02_FULL_46_13]
MTVEENVSLASLTTFKIGGPARYFCRVQSLPDLKEAVAFGKKNRLPFLILGGGSNILLPDNGFPGLVVKIDILGLEFKEEMKILEVVAGAGEIWDDLVALSVQKDLWGMENLSGIPGTVGGAPVQNIGAYGMELAKLVEWVEVYDSKTGKVRQLSVRECKFGYRDSLFKKPEGKHLIVVRVAFSLSKTARPELSYKDLKEFFKKKNKDPNLAEIRSAVLSIRSKKFPDLTRVGTAGSFFKNPVVSQSVYEKLQSEHPDLPGFPTGKGHVKLSLAWIIDHICKFKNLRVGDAIVSEKQALVICNDGHARAEDVTALAKSIFHAVKNATGIEIEPEVRLFF